MSKFTSMVQITKFLGNVTNYEKDLPIYTNRKYNLAAMLRLMKKLGNPHIKFKSIHVAGSTGKGSVCHILDGIYASNGYKTGRYISPHLKNILERICINNVSISEYKFIRSFNEIYPNILLIKPTFFEIITDLDFYIFCKEKVDIAIIETGLGGRLDCTNIIKPEVSLISKIELEHRKILGSTVEQIATEKAGIIKCMTPVVALKSNLKALSVIKKTSLKKKAPLYIIQEQKSKFDLQTFSTAFNIQINLQQLQLSHPGPSVTIPTAVSLSCKVIELLFNDFPVDILKIQRVIKEIRIPGRLQILKKNPYIIVDSAHTSQSIKFLYKSLERLDCSKIITVCTFLKDKEVFKMLRSISAHSEFVILTKLNVPRQYPIEKISKYYPNFLVTNTPKKAIKLAICKATRKSAIVITGSSYLAGHVLNS
ncbi:MAG: hypothetical protein HY606_08660 [Planctomycetes bacterium]|nr:hypothetical protein [Planctomycetota bacterium]